MTATGDRAAGDSLLVSVQLACPVGEVPDENVLTEWAVAAYGMVRHHPAELLIRIVGLDEMQALNREYRGADKPTNVLSFALEPMPGPGENLLGDIVICRDVVLDEAIEQGKEISAHWAHMTVHGVLHLCGYDHEGDAGANEMEALETAILVKLGFPTPW